MAATKDDLFERDALTPGVLDLLGTRLVDVIAAAESGDRQQLRMAERTWAAAAVDQLKIDVAVSGLGNIEDRPYVVAPLHEGFADVLAVMSLPLDLTWVIRDELLDLPYFGPYLRVGGHIAVEPELPRVALRKIMAAARSAITARESLVIFPQGSLLGLDIGFQSGAFRLAERFNVPLLPVVLTGGHRVWDYPFSQKLRYHQTMRMEVLEPIDATDAVAQMRQIERDMKRRALAVDDAPARRYVPDRDGKWEGYSFVVDPDFPEVARAAGR
jgi:1-acyl-sn-glycerol-3-phosphate acyltransferase